MLEPGVVPKKQGSGEADTGIRGLSEDSITLLFLGPEVRAGVGGDGSFQNHLGFVNSSFWGSRAGVGVGRAGVWAWEGWGRCLGGSDTVKSFLMQWCVSGLVTEPVIVFLQSSTGSHPTHLQTHTSRILKS